MLVLLKEPGQVTHHKVIDRKKGIYLRNVEPGYQKKSCNLLNVVLYEFLLLLMKKHTSCDFSSDGQYLANLLGMLCSTLNSQMQAGISFARFPLDTR